MQQSFATPLRTSRCLGAAEDCSMLSTIPCSAFLYLQCLAQCHPYILFHFYTCTMYIVIVYSECACTCSTVHVVCRSRMNDLKVTDLSEETRPIPNPVTTFKQAFTNYRNASVTINLLPHVWTWQCQKCPNLCLDLLFYHVPHSEVD